MLTAVLAILTSLAIYLCYKIAEPFVPAIALRSHSRWRLSGPLGGLRGQWGRRQTLAAGLAVVLVALLIIVPAGLLTAYIVQVAVDNVGALKDSGGLSHLRSVLEQQPLVGPLIREFGGTFRIDEHLGNIGSAIASRATRFLSGSVGVVTQLAITLFVLFFLYRDSSSSVESLRKLLPLSDDETEHLLDRVESTISATVNRSLTVALVQGILATTVYMILGVPAAVLAGTATFLAALIPVAGTFLVWAPIAIFLRQPDIRRRRSSSLRGEDLCMPPSTTSSTHIWSATNFGCTRSNVFRDNRRHQPVRARGTNHWSPCAGDYRGLGRRVVATDRIRSGGGRSGDRGARRSHQARQSIAGARKLALVF